MILKLNFFLVCSITSFAFFSYPFAFSAESVSALMIRNNLKLKIIENKLNEISENRNLRNAKVQNSNKILLKEMINIKNYLKEISDDLKEDVKTEHLAHSIYFEYMKNIEFEIRNIKKLILEKQEKIVDK